MRLFGGNARQIDLRGKTPGHGGAADAGPVPAFQQFHQARAGFFAVLNNFVMPEAQVRSFPAQLGQFYRLRANIESDESLDTGPVDFRPRPDVAAL